MVKMSEQLKDLNYYMSLRYPILLTEDEDGTWFVEIPLLDGCVSVGNDIRDAIEMIEDAKRGWLEVSLEMGLPIPKPEIEPAL